ncbi:MAG: PAS domain-containing protein [Candidatus Aenigmarchaeota archaeon]|nr:PAS domain-containing protein [Candidatus Aenigmarchaeota archaeon]
METVSGIVANLQGEIVAYGEGAEKIFGYRRDEILGKNVAIFHPPGSEATLRDLFQTAMTTGTWEKDTRLVRKGGEVFPAHLKVTAIRDDRGNITGLAGMTRDLSR